MVKNYFNKLILLVEDEQEVLDILHSCLTQAHITLIDATTLKLAKRLVSEQKPNLVIIDRQLSKEDDGIDLVKYIRGNQELKHIGIIMLTAKNTKENIRAAFSLNIDDYITKPFDGDDVAQRVVAVLRRVSPFLDDTINLAQGLVLNVSQQCLLRNNQKISLQTVVYKILLMLCRRRGHIISRENIITQVWRNDDIGMRTVDVHIARLRKDLGRYSGILQTVSGAGYKLVHYSDTEQHIQPSTTDNQQNLVLASSIAHEMRTPLHKFALLADLIEDQEIAQLMTATVKGADNVIELILNNIRSQKIDKSTFKPLAIGEASVQALAVYPFNPGERERVQLKIASDFNIMASHNLFNCILFNLLKNAIYYFASNQDMTITINIATTKQGNILSFTDTGVGIAKHKITQLFKDFVASDKTGGTGLGLPFCKRVMKSFGGSISCKSQLNKYTQFTLKFPATDATVTAEQQAAAISYNFKQPHRILVIEDDIIVIKLLRAIFSQLNNIQVIFAEDGITAIAKTRELQPELILTDLHVPLVAGEALIDNLRQATSSKVPIISYSAAQPAASIKDKLDDSLAKPASKKNLIEKLQQYLD